MPHLVRSPKFEKAIRALGRRDPDLAGRVREALKRFAADVHHPSLNFEKVLGTDYCSIRVNRGDRIILKLTGPDTFDLVDLGNHDTMYRRYG